MNNTILQTEYILPLSYINNGLLSSQWKNPSYLLLEDSLTAESNSSQSANADIMLSNYNLNIPVGAVITGIQFKVFGYAGSVTVPPSSLSFNAVDDTTGTIIYYPYTAPFTGFTQSMGEYVFGSQNYLFNHAWTVDEINNFKLQLIGAGDLFIDTVAVQVFYYIPSTGTAPADTTNTCLDCESQIQGVEYFLALELLATDTKAYVYNFNYADGTPIQISDLGDCGGTIDMVIDEGKIATNGSTFMENVRVVDINRLPSGLVELDFGTLNNRGLAFKTPYTHVTALTIAHPVNAKIIISNDAPFYDKMVKKCQAGIVFSEPIEVKNESVSKVNPTVRFNFKGAGQSVAVDPLDPEQANITIPGFGVNPPNLVSVTSGTSGNTQVSTLSIDLDISGLNRGAVVNIATEEAQTVTSVTVGGVACTQAVSDTDAVNNLRSEIWTCVNPPLGTQSVVITLSGPAYLTFGAEALAEIDTSNMVGSTQNATGSSLTPTLNITTTNNNSIVIDGLVTGTTPILYTVGAGQSLNWSLTANGITRQGASSVESAGIAPDVVTMDYAITPSTPWVITAIEINGIPAVTPVVSPLAIKDEGTTIEASTTVINFKGAGVTATSVSPGVVDVDIPGGGSGSGEVVQKTITQTAHGLSDSTVVKSSGTNGEFDYAQSDVPANADVVGIITSVPNANTFVLTTEGFAIIPTLPGGAVAGDNLWLSDTVAGELTLTEPTTAGTISQPVARVLNASTKLCYIHNWRGQENQALPVVAVIYTNGTTTKDTSDASTVQNIPHGLGQIPKKIKMTALLAYYAGSGGGGGVNNLQAISVYNGTNQSSISMYGTQASPTTDATFTLQANGSATDKQVGVITFDVTNIIITWTHNAGTGGATYQLLWEAEA